MGGIVFGAIGVFAATTLLSQSVYYNNSNSGATSTNVQGALDELYTKANTWIDPNNMGEPTYFSFGEPTYFSFGEPTTSSSTTPPSDMVAYIGLYDDGQYGVCIKRNGKQHCFRYNNWIAESKHVQNAFSDISCNVSSNSVNCIASDFFCNLSSNGDVGCGDYIFGHYCNIMDGGSLLFCDFA